MAELAPASSLSPPPAAGDREGVAVVPYFTLASRLRVPRCLQRKKLMAAKPVVLFSLPPPSPDLPIKAGIELLNTSDMVSASH
jgi:hypothetical protein